MVVIREVNRIAGVKEQRQGRSSTSTAGTKELPKDHLRVFPDKEYDTISNVLPWNEKPIASRVFRTANPSVGSEDVTTDILMDDALCRQMLLSREEDASPNDTLNFRRKDDVEMRYYANDTEEEVEKAWNLFHGIFYNEGQNVLKWRRNEILTAVEKRNRILYGESNVSFAAITSSDANVVIEKKTDTDTKNIAETKKTEDEKTLSETKKDSTKKDSETSKATKPDDITTKESEELTEKELEILEFVDKQFLTGDMLEEMRERMEENLDSSVENLNSYEQEFVDLLQADLTEKKSLEVFLPVGLNVLHNSSDSQMVQTFLQNFDSIVNPSKEYADESANNTTSKRVATEKQTKGEAKAGKKVATAKPTASAKPTAVINSTRAITNADFQKSLKAVLGLDLGDSTFNHMKALCRSDDENDDEKESPRVDFGRGQRFKSRLGTSRASMRALRDRAGSGTRRIGGCLSPIKGIRGISSNKSMTLKRDADKDMNATKDSEGNTTKDGIPRVQQGSNKLLNNKAKSEDNTPRNSAGNKPSSGGEKAKESAKETAAAAAARAAAAAGYSATSWDWWNIGASNPTSPKYTPGIMNPSSPKKIPKKIPAAVVKEPVGNNVEKSEVEKIIGLSKTILQQTDGFPEVALSVTKEASVETTKEVNNVKDNTDGASETCVDGNCAGDNILNAEMETFLNPEMKVILNEILTTNDVKKDELLCGGQEDSNDIIVDSDSDKIVDEGGDWDMDHWDMNQVKNEDKYMTSNKESAEDMDVNNDWNIIDKDSVEKEMELINSTESVVKNISMPAVVIKDFQNAELNGSWFEFPEVRICGKSVWFHENKKHFMIDTANWDPIRMKVPDTTKNNQSFIEEEDNSIKEEDFVRKNKDDMEIDDPTEMNIPFEKTIPSDNKQSRKDHCNVVTNDHNASMMKEDEGENDKNDTTIEEIDLVNVDPSKLVHSRLINTLKEKAMEWQNNSSKVYGSRMSRYARARFERNSGGNEMGWSDPIWCELGKDLSKITDAITAVTKVEKTDDTSKTFIPHSNDTRNDKNTILRTIHGRIKKNDPGYKLRKKTLLRGKKDDAIGEDQDNHMQIGDDQEENHMSSEDDDDVSGASGGEGVSGDDDEKNRSSDEKKPLEEQRQESVLSGDLPSCASAASRVSATSSATDKSSATDQTLNEGGLYMHLEGIAADNRDPDDIAAEIAEDVVDGDTHSDQELIRKLSKQHQQDDKDGRDVMDVKRHCGSLGKPSQNQRTQAQPIHPPGEIRGSPRARLGKIGARSSSEVALSLDGVLAKSRKLIRRGAAFQKGVSDLMKEFDRPVGRNEDPSEVPTNVTSKAILTEEVFAEKFGVEMDKALVESKDAAILHPVALDFEAQKSVHTDNAEKCDISESLEKNAESMWEDQTKSIASKKEFYESKSIESRKFEEDLFTCMQKKLCGSNSILKSIMQREFWKELQLKELWRKIRNTYDRKLWVKMYLEGLYSLNFIDDCAMEEVGQMISTTDEMASQMHHRMEKKEIQMEDRKQTEMDSLLGSFLPYPELFNQLVSSLITGEIPDLEELQAQESEQEAELLENQPMQYKTRDGKPFHDLKSSSPFGYGAHHKDRHAKDGDAGNKGSSRFQSVERRSERSIHRSAVNTDRGGSTRRSRFGRNRLFGMHGEKYCGKSKFDDWNGHNPKKMTPDIVAVTGKLKRGQGLPTTKDGKSNCTIDNYRMFHNILQPEIHEPLAIMDKKTVKLYESHYAYKSECFADPLDDPVDPLDIAELELKKHKHYEEQKSKFLADSLKKEETRKRKLDLQLTELRRLADKFLVFDVKDLPRVFSTFIDNDCDINEEDCDKEMSFHEILRLCYKNCITAGGGIVDIDLTTIDSTGGLIGEVDCVAIKCQKHQRLEKKTLLEEMSSCNSGWKEVVENSKSKALILQGFRQEFLNGVFLRTTMTQEKFLLLQKNSDFDQMKKFFALETRPWSYLSTTYKKIVRSNANQEVNGNNQNSKKDDDKQQKSKNNENKLHQLAIKDEENKRNSKEDAQMPEENDQKENDQKSRTDNAENSIDNCNAIVQSVTGKSANAQSLNMEKSQCGTVKSQTTKQNSSSSHWDRYRYQTEPTCTALYDNQSGALVIIKSVRKDGVHKAESAHAKEQSVTKDTNSVKSEDDDELEHIPCALLHPEKGWMEWSGSSWLRNSEARERDIITRVEGENHFEPLILEHPEILTLLSHIEGDDESVLGKTLQEIEVETDDAVVENSRKEDVAVESKKDEAESGPLNNGGSKEHAQGHSKPKSDDSDDGNQRLLKSENRYSDSDTSPTQLYPLNPLWCHPKHKSTMKIGKKGGVQKHHLIGETPAETREKQQVVLESLLAMAEDFSDCSDDSDDSDDLDVEEDDDAFLKRILERPDDENMEERESASPKSGGRNPEKSPEKNEKDEDGDIQMGGISTADKKKAVGKNPESTVEKKPKCWVNPRLEPFVPRFKKGPASLKFNFQQLSEYHLSDNFLEENPEFVKRYQIYSSVQRENEKFMQQLESQLREKVASILEEIVKTKEGKEIFGFPVNCKNKEDTIKKSEIKRKDDWKDNMKDDIKANKEAWGKWEKDAWGKWKKVQQNHDWKASKRRSGLRSSSGFNVNHTSTGYDAYNAYNAYKDIKDCDDVDPSVDDPSGDDPFGSDNDNDDNKVDDSYDFSSKNFLKKKPETQQEIVENILKKFLSSRDSEISKILSEFFKELEKDFGNLPCMHSFSMGHPSYKESCIVRDETTLDRIKSIVRREAHQGGKEHEENKTTTKETIIPTLDLPYQPLLRQEISNMLAKADEIHRSEKDSWTTSAVAQKPLIDVLTAEGKFFKNGMVHEEKEEESDQEDETVSSDVSSDISDSSGDEKSSANEDVDQEMNGNVEPGYKTPSSASEDYDQENVSQDSQDEVSEADGSESMEVSRTEIEKKDVEGDVNMQDDPDDMEDENAECDEDTPEKYAECEEEETEDAIPAEKEISLRRQLLNELETGDVFSVDSVYDADVVAQEILGGAEEKFVEGFKEARERKEWYDSEKWQGYYPSEKWREWTPQKNWDKERYAHDWYAGYKEGYAENKLCSQYEKDHIGRDKYDKFTDKYDKSLDKYESLVELKRDYRGDKRELLKITFSGGKRERGDAPKKRTGWDVKDTSKSSEARDWDVKSDHAPPPGAPLGAPPPPGANTASSSPTHSVSHSTAGATGAPTEVGVKAARAFNFKPVQPKNPVMHSFTMHPTQSGTTGSLQATTSMQRAASAVPAGTVPNQYQNPYHGAQPAYQNHYAVPQTGQVYGHQEAPRNDDPTPAGFHKVDYTPHHHQTPHNPTVDGAKNATAAPSFANFVDNVQNMVKNTQTQQPKAGSMGPPAVRPSAISTLPTGLPAGLPPVPVGSRISPLPIPGALPAGNLPAGLPSLPAGQPGWPAALPQTPAPMDAVALDCPSPNTMALQMQHMQKQIDEMQQQQKTMEQFALQASIPLAHQGSVLSLPTPYQPSSAVVTTTAYNAGSASGVAVGSGTAYNTANAYDPRGAAGTTAGVYDPRVGQVKPSTPRRHDAYEPRGAYEHAYDPRGAKDGYDPEHAYNPGEYEPAYDPRGGTDVDNMHPAYAADNIDPAYAADRRQSYHEQYPAHGHAAYGQSHPANHQGYEQGRHHDAYNQARQSYHGTYGGTYHQAPNHNGYNQGWHHQGSHQQSYHQSGHHQQGYHQHQHNWKGGW